MLNPHMLHGFHNIIIIVGALGYVVVKRLYQRKKSSKFNISNTTNQDGAQIKDVTIRKMSHKQADELLKDSTGKKNLKTKVISGMLGELAISAFTKLKDGQLDQLTDKEKAWLDSLPPALKKIYAAAEESQAAGLKPAQSGASTAPITKTHESDVDINAHTTKKSDLPLPTTSTSGSIEISHHKKHKSIIEV